MSQVNAIKDVAVVGGGHGFGWCVWCLRAGLGAGGFPAWVAGYGLWPRRVAAEGCGCRCGFRRCSAEAGEVCCWPGAVPGWGRPGTSCLPLWPGMAAGWGPRPMQSGQRTVCRVPARVGL